MSKFFFNLFNTQRKPAIKSPNNDKNNNKNDSNDDEDITAFSRRMSMTKSGRLKENKRKTRSVSDYFPTTTTTTTTKENNKDSGSVDDLCTSEDEVIRELQEISLKNRQC